ncbi:hypothetical protein NL676_028751 [Syzygium grande]|nr:hypothetical protein NL676_028751 [Syzygium grande]
MFCKPTPDCSLSHARSCSRRQSRIAIENEQEKRTNHCLHLTIFPYARRSNAFDPGDDFLLEFVFFAPIQSLGFAAAVDSFRE